MNRTRSGALRQQHVSATTTLIATAVLVRPLVPTTAIATIAIGFNYVHLHAGGVTFALNVAVVTCALVLVWRRNSVEVGVDAVVSS